MKKRKEERRWRGRERKAKKREEERRWRGIEQKQKKREEEKRWRGIGEKRRSEKRSDGGEEKRKAKKREEKRRRKGMEEKRRNQLQREPPSDWLPLTRSGWLLTGGVRLCVCVDVHVDMDVRCACVYTVYGLRPYVRTFISFHMFTAADGVEGGGGVVKMLMT